jgi:hypothetical protein
MINPHTHCCNDHSHAELMFNVGAVYCSFYHIPIPDTMLTNDLSKNNSITRNSINQIDYLYKHIINIYDTHPAGIYRGS